MPYLIDGHNLIPKLGLRLDFIDDEMALIRRLQEFCRLRRVQVEVFFDGAPPGKASTIKSGSITAHFIQKGSSADAAIEFRLSQLGKAAKNWTVVSSDNRLLRSAGAVHARALSSEEFSREMIKSREEQKEESDGSKVLSPDEVNEWLKIFKTRGK
jgi:predicted RNA-binding protein with PIN domain